MSKFTCTICGGTFENPTNWGEVEIAEESQKLWGISPGDKRGASICDDCYQEFMAWFNRNYGN